MSEQEVKTYVVEYEIFPMRAIFQAECDHVGTAEDVAEFIKMAQPTWNIRRISLTNQ